MKGRSLASLRHWAFRRLFAGQLGSNLGDACYAVALPWYVLSQHGGAVRLGEVLAAYGIARTASLVIGGHVSDRLQPWSAMMGADLVRAAALGALTIVAIAGPARLVLLLPIAVIVGAGEGIFLPASFAITPALLPDEDLQAGNAVTSGGTQAATLIGPVIGGTIVELVGPALAFGVDAVSFLLSAWTLAAIRGRTRPRGGTGPGQPPSLWRIVRTQRIVGLIFVINLAANLGSGGISEVALPSLAHGPLHDGAAGYGALVAAYAAGALAGTVAAARIGRLRSPAIVASVGFLGEAVFMALVPYLGGTIPGAAALVVYGALNGFSNVVTITAVQRWAPRVVLGRLMGFLMLGSLGIFPVSVLLGSFVVHAAGPALFFPLSAATVAVTVSLALTQQEWRNFGSDTSLRPQVADDAESVQHEVAIAQAHRTLT